VVPGHGLKIRGWIANFWIDDGYPSAGPA